MAYIEREAVIKAINVCKTMMNTGYPKQHMSQKDILRIIEQTPAADVAPVVRCKDCKNWHEETGWCYEHSHFLDADRAFCHPWESAEWKMFDADYFCKDGERKDGEG